MAYLKVWEVLGQEHGRNYTEEQWLDRVGYGKEGPSYQEAEDYAAWAKRCEPSRNFDSIKFTHWNGKHTVERIFDLED